MSLGPFEYNTDSSWSAPNLNQLLILLYTMFYYISQIVRAL